MSRIPRKNLEDGFYHIMVQGIKKENIFDKDENKSTYIRLMKLFIEKLKIEMAAYCVMSNHTHMIIQVDDIAQLSTYMSKLNTTYAQYYNKKEQRVGYVFRNRYKSKKIYSQNYLTQCIKYVHMNPVKAGIAKEEGEYKYSSYNQYIEANGIVSKQLLEKIFNSNEYLKEFLKLEYNEKLFKDFEEEEKKDIQQELEKFLNKEEIKLEELQKDKRLIKKIYKNIGLYTTKAELARKIGISRVKISRILNEDT